MFSQATSFLHPIGQLPLKRSQFAGRPKRRPVAKKRAKSLGAPSIKILIGRVLRSDIRSSYRMYYQVRWLEKPYLDDDLVRHCSVFINLWRAQYQKTYNRSAGRNLTICRQKSGNLAEEIAALLRVRVTCPGISGFPHNGVDPGHRTIVT